jgi:hypothetical protein
VDNPLFSLVRRNHRNRSGDYRLILPQVKGQSIGQLASPISPRLHRVKQRVGMMPLRKALAGAPPVVADSSVVPTP